MRTHRFYIQPQTVELKHDFWLHEPGLLHQWNKVLRFQPGQQVVLFDGVTHDRLYKITEIDQTEAHLHHVTDLERRTPAKELFLFWSLLKKDKNDWVLQKCTELGVSHFIPILADRSEKTGFNLERAQKIIIEASEQCGRSDIPVVRKPMGVENAINDYKDKIQLLVCEQTDIDEHEINDPAAAGILIGPEGGWSDNEKQLFQKLDIKHLNLHDFTLRAETACVAAATKLLQ